jgi:dimeric dUTPase (all-alpha-NTP-PPase superfamily)
MASFLSLLQAQNTLQTETYGYDFKAMGQLERIQFIKENVLALSAELHEALDETGWKTWATSNHLNEEAYLGELVDLFHFFMNLILVLQTPSIGEAVSDGVVRVRPGIDYVPATTVNDLAEVFTQRYFQKNARNTQRQVDGYDGVSSKCPVCKRALDDMSQGFTAPELICDGTVEGCRFPDLASA